MNKKNRFSDKYNDYVNDSNSEKRSKPVKNRFADAYKDYYNEEKAPETTSNEPTDLDKKGEPKNRFSSSYGHYYPKNIASKAKKSEKNSSTYKFSDEIKKAGIDTNLLAEAVNGPIAGKAKIKK